MTWWSLLSGLASVRGGEGTVLDDFPLFDILDVFCFFLGGCFTLPDLLISPWELLRGDVRDFRFSLDDDGLEFLRRTKSVSSLLEEGSLQMAFSGLFSAAILAPIA